MVLDELYAALVAICAKLNLLQHLIQFEFPAISGDLQPLEVHLSRLQTLPPGNSAAKACWLVDGAADLRGQPELPLGEVHIESVMREGEAFSNCHEDIVGCYGCYELGEAVLEQQIGLWLLLAH